MFNKIKAKWNVMFTHSVVFVAFAMFESLVHNDMTKSLTFFGIGLVFMGLADLYNQNIKTQAMLKTLLKESDEKWHHGKIMIKTNTDPIKLG